MVNAVMQSFWSLTVDSINDIQKGIFFFNFSQKQTRTTVYLETSGLQESSNTLKLYQSF